MLFIFAVLAVGCTDKPADTAEDVVFGGPTEGSTEEGGYTVRYQSDPDPIPLSEGFTVTTTVLDADGAALPDVEVVVDGWMPEHGHGMNTVASTAPDGHGGYLTEGLLFHMPGAWEILVDVTADGVTERATLPYACCAD